MSEMKLENVQILLTEAIWRWIYTLVHTVHTGTCILLTKRKRLWGCGPKIHERSITKRPGPNNIKKSNLIGWFEVLTLWDNLVIQCICLHQPYFILNSKSSRLWLWLCSIGLFRYESKNHFKWNVLCLWLFNLSVYLHVQVTFTCMCSWTFK